MARQQPSTLFYDAECGFCRASVGLILTWDRDRRLRPVALQDPSAAQALAGLSEEDRAASWHLVTSDGDRRSGGAAFAPLFEILPRGAPLANLARRFPSGTRRLYALVVENRDSLARLLPSRLRRSAEETIRRRGEDGTEEGVENRAEDGSEDTVEDRSEDRSAPAPGFPEPPGKDPGALSGGRDPHHVLNNPVVDDPDLTEWPDPYETREDPRDPPDPDGLPFGEQPHPQTGSISTSEPHPSKDPEATDRWEAPKRDKLDD